MSNQEKANENEIRELLKKAEECKQLIQDAEDALDAVLEDLEEAYAEAYEGKLVVLVGNDEGDM